MTRIHGTDRLGFRTHAPEHWNRWWLRMWAIAAPALVVSAFLIPFRLWVPAAVVGFLVPELLSLVKQDDAFPPLTHTIRHFLPNWLAFPLIYFSVGSVGAHWLRVGRPFSIGALFALLRWLTDHFIVTYDRPDPFPFTNRPVRPGTDRQALPA